MKNNKNLEKREAKILYAPTSYVFDLTNVSCELYADALNVLLHDPEFNSVADKRNRLIKSASQLKTHSPEMASLIRTIQKYDRTMADMMFATIVQTNVNTTNVLCNVTFSSLLKYYVDYNKNDMKTKVNALSANLDKLAFLADMLEGLLVDIKADMEHIFSGYVEFKQFDAVNQVMAQLKSFFESSSRSKDPNSRETQLYIEYSDSINEYLDKRMKTFSEKYRKLRPLPKVYTKEQMVTALNKYMGTVNTFDDTFLAKLPAGGMFIDVISVINYDITPSQKEKIIKAIGHLEKSSDADSYAIRFTDVVLKEFYG